MKRYEGKVTMHNGHYERTFGVRLSASNWHTAVKVAMLLATKALRDHYKRMSTKKRVHIEGIYIHLAQYKPLVDDDPLPTRVWLTNKS